jgi:tetratricopeptide (TPR) repeat protein
MQKRILRITVLSITLGLVYILLGSWLQPMARVFASPWKQAPITEISEIDALTPDQNGTATCLNRGAHLYYMNKYRKSIDVLTVCIEEGLASDKAYYTRGKAHFELGDYHRAIKDFSRSIASNPANEDALIQRARAHYNMDEVVYAAEDVTTVLHISHNDLNISKALQLRGRLFVKEGREDLAMQDFRKAQELYSRYFGFSFYLDYMNPKQISFLGILVLIVVVVVLIFKLKLPPPKK